LRHVLIDCQLREAPAESAPAIASLRAGDPFRMLDASLGWAWGYAPGDRVGYVEAAATGA